MRLRAIIENEQRDSTDRNGAASVFAASSSHRNKDAMPGDYKITVFIVGFIAIPVVGVVGYLVRRWKRS